MELKGKKVLFLGDSITEGVGASSYENSYVSVFEKMSGADVKNYGVSGTRIAKQSGKSEYDEWNYDFLMRADDMEEGADIVVVFGGTNDYGHGDASMGDFASTSEYTFYGALHSLCNRLINKYPDAVILFMTPLHREGEEAFVTVDGHEKPALSDYVSAVKKVAAFYGLPVLDLYAVSGMQPKVAIVKEKYMPDGLHPSDAGAKRIAERLSGFLSAL